MPTSTTGVATDFITFTRASNATVTDSDGKIKWAPHNLLTNSESFDAGNWTKTSATVAANSVASPSGQTTADNYVPTAGTVSPTIEQGVFSLTSGAGYMFSIYLKDTGNGSGWVEITMLNPTIRSWFDLRNGVKGTGDGTISPVGGGWYLCTVPTTLNNTSTIIYISPRSANGSSGSIVAIAVPYVSLWGAHLYRSDLGGMQANTSAYPMYNPTTPKNKLGFTEAFSDAAWTKNGSTIIANAVVAPNGLQTADKILESTASAPHGLYNATGLNSTTGAPYVYSVYAKAAERSIIYIDAYTGSGAFTYFNLANGTVGTSAAGSTGSIQSVGDGWYRCSVVRNSTQSTNQFIGVYIAQTDNVASYTGDGVSGVYIWGAQLSDSASLDAYVPSYGAAVTSAAYYGPRRDFDPVTLGCKGLLVEEQRSNILLRSAEFDVAPWGLTRATISANAVAAPDGTTTADKLVETADTGTHAVTAASATITLAAYTGSVYLKAAERTWAVVGIGSSTNGLAYFDLGTGAVGTVTGGFTASIIAVGNGWYRCTISGSIASSSSSPFAIYTATGNGVVSYAGDITNGIYIWGAQLEAGSFATSYIPTGSATATRSADVASVSTQAFPYSSTEGTYVASFQTLFSGTSAASSIVLSADGSLSKRIAQIAAATDVVSTLDASGTISATGDVTGAVAKVGSAYDASNRYIVANGGTVASGTIAAGYGTASSTVIGGVTGSNYLNGHIRQITYLPRRISNAELQSRTA